MPRPPFARTARIVVLALTLASLALPAATPVFSQGLNAVVSRDGVDVWAVGQLGQIRRSLDSGATWSAATLGDKALRGVAARGFTVFAVGDSGKIWRSTNSGGTWSLTVLPGGPDLYAIEFPSDQIAYIAGAGEGIWKTDNAGNSWSLQTLAGPATLKGLKFRDTQHGWAVGTGGKALSTTDGTSWVPSPTPTSHELLCVDFIGNDVWAVGAFGVALKSANAGSLWTHLDLKMETPSDVRAVWMGSPTQVTLTGGGGFLRSTSDGGTSWTFATHPLLQETSDYFTDGLGKAWATSKSSVTVIRTLNSGATWQLPNLTNTTYTWNLKQTTGAITRGNTFATTPQNRDMVFCVMGSSIYKSRNRGETWTLVNNIPSSSKTNSFFVSPKDTNTWIAAVGTPDRIVKTTNGGANWTNVLNRDFTEYGMPLEMNPDKTDTLYFGPEDGKIYRIKGWGTSFDTLSVPAPPFRSPCDIVITPGNDANVLVGDGVTGSGNAKIFQSENGGVNWSDRLTGEGSETPCVWSSRLGNTAAFLTQWSSGGVWRSLDSGKNWTQVTTVSSAWGGHTATDDPKLVVFNRYAGTPNYISFDGGTSFTSTSLSSPGSGYAIHAMDRSTILDMHSAGIYKLLVGYSFPPATAPTVLVSSPNGGESWDAGDVRNVTWSASNLALARIEYRRGPAEPWQLVANVEGYLGTYAWTVPNDPTTEAMVRVMDAWDSSPVDVSNGVFTIRAPRIASDPASIDFALHPVGSATTEVLNIENTGTAPLVISSITAPGVGFRPGRTGFTVAAGATDTTGVTFEPSAATSYNDVLHIVHNGGAEVLVPLAGVGVTGPTVILVSPNGGEAWQYAKSYPITWQSLGVSQVALDYRVDDDEPWIEVATGLAAGGGSWPWIVPYAPTAVARVRVREVAGSLEDASNNVFALTSPEFLAMPVPRDVGVVLVGTTAGDTIRVENKGTAPLTISNITSDNAAFFPGRTAFVLDAGEADTLGAFFLPASTGPDSALFTITADDPIGTHAIRIYGEGTLPVAADDGPTPGTFALYAGQPNPFQRSTVLRFALPRRASVALEIFNLQGQRVTTLVRGEQEPGVHNVVFRPGGGEGAGREAIASGVYFVRFTAPGFSSTQKILYMAP
ncbi:MAG: choice-of-anchor D domain-containing protein [Candidatus Eiseniibacteriota bacterium]